MNLTNRQREVANLLVQGKSYQEIANLMGITRSTAKYYAAQIYRNAGVSGPVGGKHAYIRLMNVLKEE